MAEFRTDKKCPKCGSQDFMITNYCTMDLLYESKGGEVEPMGMGDYSKTISTICDCYKCGYSWHPKGAAFEKN